jgi:hypothetical protein
MKLTAAIAQKLFCLSLPPLVEYVKANADGQRVSALVGWVMRSSVLELTAARQVEVALLAIANMCPHVPTSVLEPEVLQTQCFSARNTWP